MELTRRDALAALAGTGVAVGTGAAAVARSTLRERATDLADDPAVDGLVAVARIVYPSAVEGVDGFVRTIVAGRIEDRPAYGEGVRATVSELDDRAREWHGESLPDLDPGPRERLLREVGADTADPDPEGTTAEQVRYYVVDELLYALYASPTGGDLVGIENPQGHPGGTDSYRRGPRG